MNDVTGQSEPRRDEDPAGQFGHSNCELATQLIASYQREDALSGRGRDLPSPPEISAILSAVRELLLPGSTGTPRPRGGLLHSFVEGQIATLRVKLVQQLFRGIFYRWPGEKPDCVACEAQASQIAAAFLDQLPELRRLVLSDVMAAFEGDPAATGLDEVAFSYPGVHAVTVYRIAHALWQLGAQVVPRMMSEQAHAEAGIDIHPAAQIGESFFIDHGTGVVIGETTQIGARVRIYQGVTLGALSLPRGTVRGQVGHKRHPTIEDDVVIYANATILGGQTVIGRGAVIGGNAFVTDSVPPGVRVANPCR
jgi:serine O-acetyltransferase